MNTDSASTSSLQTQALLIHHSWDTARKQWAETEVLTLNGVARLFQTRWSTLVGLEGFNKAWGTLLEFIKSCAQSLSTEVSEAALKSFHTILVAPPPLRVRSTTVVKSSPPPSNQGEGPHEVTPTTSSLAMEQLLWEKAWRAWHMIGIECVCKRLPPLEKFRVFLNRTPQTKDESDSFFSSVPSQAILIYLVQLFPPIYARVRSKFTGTDFQEAAKILYTSLIMPVSKDTSPFLVPSHNEHMLNSLQKDILKSMASFFTKEDVFDHEDGGPQTLFGKKTELVDTNRRVELLGEGSATPLFPLVIAELLRYGHLATTPPEMVGVYQEMPRPPIMAVNYVPFSVSATGLVVVLYCSSVEGGAVPISSSLTADCLKALHVPLKLKYRCVQPVVWMYSLDALLAILKSILPQVLSQGDANSQFWNELASIFEDFLFNDIPEGVELPMEKSSEYETHDIKLVEMIKRDILPTSTRAPKDFLEKLMAVLNRGSIHSIADHYEDSAVSARVPFRERFARSCFEALLQFSFLHSQDSNIDPTSQLALNALLERCKEVLAKFVHEERLSGQCPLPRSRMNEVSLVLKSVSVLISSLKEAQKSSAKVDKSIWKQVVLLYPALVQCVTCLSMEVRFALKEVLSQFSELIKP